MSSSEQSRYEDLLQRYLQPLRRLAWSYARDHAECDDLLQEIALALWTALPRFRGESSERTWLYRIAHNTSISYLTTSKRRRARESNAPAITEPASENYSPETKPWTGKSSSGSGARFVNCPYPTVRSSFFIWKA
jgi:RNA polymerase sigma factor (sigma-70 family)